MKKRKLKKIFNLIKGILNTLLIVALACFVLAVCLQRFTDNKIALMDYRLFTVVTGSMEPKYNVGDVLISKVVEPETIKIGDTVSYLGAEGNFNGKIVTHEVINIEKNEIGELLFHTKGIANLVQDPVVNESQLYGKIVYKATLLSFVYKTISSKLGMLLCVILPLMVIIATEIIATLLESEEEKRKARANK
jgi:signal peptidase